MLFLCTIAFKYLKGKQREREREVAKGIQFVIKMNNQYETFTTIQ